MSAICHSPARLASSSSSMPSPEGMAAELLRLSSTSPPAEEVGGAGGLASGSTNATVVEVDGATDMVVEEDEGSVLPLGVLRPLPPPPPAAPLPVVAAPPPPPLLEVPRCESLGIWNLLCNPLMKPSMLAAIVGEAYWRIVIMSV